MVLFGFVLASGHRDCRNGKFCFWQCFANDCLDRVANRNGGACAINAARCGRVHCYLTGPFFLLMAVVTLLHGIGVVRLGDKGWNLIGLTILVRTIALCCLPERILGKYRGARAGGERHE